MRAPASLATFVAMLDDIDQTRVRETFELALERDDEFPRLFYDILFHRHPETVPLFWRNTIGAQRTMVGQTLAAIVDHLGDEEWLSTNLRHLGRGHLDYGVTPVMYDWVGDALIDAVAERCADEWTPDHGRAWRAAYERIVAFMRAGEVDP